MFFLCMFNQLFFSVHIQVIVACPYMIFSVHMYIFPENYVNRGFVYIFVILCVSHVFEIFF